MNYFEVFGLAKTLTIDPQALEKKFHELSRKHHPDFFTTAPAVEREQALKLTATLNDAYRTLRHPVRRVEYLVGLEGFKPDGSKVPKSFLMEIFEINEQLDELKTASAGPERATRMASLKAEIQSRAADFEAQLEAGAAEWDALLASGADQSRQKQQLSRLTEILSASSYIRNLQRDVEETL